MCNEGQSIQSKMFTGCGHRVDCWMMCKVIVHLLHLRIFPCCCCFTHRVNQKNQKTEFIWERIWLARIRSTHDSNEGPLVMVSANLIRSLGWVAYTCLGHTAVNNFELSKVAILTQDRGWHPLMAISVPGLKRLSILVVWLRPNARFNQRCDQQRWVAEAMMICE